MCGIFGGINLDYINAQELQAISSTIRHRGPDDEGFLIMNSHGVSIYGGSDTPNETYSSDLEYCPSSPLPLEGKICSQPAVFLGHRRLSIVDLSPRGHQPMSYMDRYWISFNGEIYNFLEIRRELIEQGYQFRSDTDTEVILAAYDAWGIGCLSRFNGMWAIAIIDLLDEKILLARDRFGVKPLYLFSNSNKFYFASEIKAFTATNDWMPSANKKEAMDFLVWGITDHTCQTMFSGIEQLPPGCLVQIDLNEIINNSKESHIPIKPNYERWYFFPKEDLSKHISNVESKFQSILKDSVDLRLRADVNVGSCLSGGLDSSSIVCLAGGIVNSKINGLQLHTFTAGSLDAAYDEVEYATAAANSISAKMHKIYPNPLELFEVLDKITWHQDEPFNSTSIFAQWCVFGSAKAGGIKVLMDGQGADELLCGYRGYYGAYLAGLLKKFRFKKWISKLREINEYSSITKSVLLGYSLFYLMPKFAVILGKFVGKSYSENVWVAPHERTAFKEDPLAKLGGRAASLRGMSMSQIKHTNLPMLLHWEDRNSMAFSIEARIPFLDYRVVEFCLGLADEEKINRGVLKSILRKAMRGIVPDVILDRRDKLGFATAELLWATRDIKEKFRQELCIAVEQLPTLLSSNIINQFDQVVAGEKKYDQRYWRAISLAHWVKVFNIRNFI